MAFDHQRAERSLTAIDFGEKAARELREAMKLTGVVFPSLIGGFPSMDVARVELGGMSAESALELAKWIREHA